jgi:hypothetical protein
MLISKINYTNTQSGTTIQYLLATSFGHVGPSAGQYLRKLFQHNSQQITRLKVDNYKGC